MTQKNQLLHHQPLNHQPFLESAARDYQQLQKDVLALNHQHHHYRHALEAAMFRAQGFDNLIRALYADETDLPFALVATGGYGRGRLAPFSDIDLLFIHHKDADLTHVTPLMERCLYVLWDLHVKLGYKIGTNDEMMQGICDDIAAATALIDMRFITGDKQLYDDFATHSLIWLAKNLPREKFFAGKMQETEARHAKQGDTRYLLEPNIKEGRGGLRDLDMLYWLCSYQPELGALNQKNALQEKLGAQLYRDYQYLEKFLWNIRFLNHMISGRGVEILTLDIQPEIAEKLGYRVHENNIGKRVERFMRHYFFNSRKIGFLMRTVVADIEISHNRKIFALPQSAYQEVKGFRRQGRFLSFKQQDTPKTNPLSMLSILNVAMQHNLSLHPQALRAMIQYHNLLAAYRDDATANKIFLQILTQGEKGVWALKRMSDTGLLGVFVPAFRNIIAQMQFNRYHYYTTDTHTFHALNILAKIENVKISGGLHRQLPLISHLAHDKKYRRKLLYCALFLHDIGKGQKEHHSIVGEQVAQELCPRLGFDKEETSMVSWLVRHHLEMSDTAFKRDLLDRRTIADFAHLVENQERLQLLLMLTVIDIKAVSPVSWNSHKDTLLHELYSRTLDMLSQQAQFGYYVDDEDALLRANLVAALKHESIKAEDYVRHLPENYLKAYSEEEIIYHAKIVFALEEKTPPYDTQHFHLRFHEQSDMEKEGDGGHLRVGFIVRWYPRCFTDCAAIIALASGNIVQANLFRISSDYVVVYFVSRFANFRTVSQHLQKFANDILGNILNGDKELYRSHIDALHQKMAEQPKGSDGHNIAQSSIVRQGEVKFHLNISDLYTVIEVSARDRQGLLYQIADRLSEDNIQINVAKIATFGEEAIDSFYVKDAFGFKLENKHVLDNVKKKLQKVLRKYTI
ncbi:MAG: [protein-PII] uridylyltransferase [Alphaproteobacteria bacterium]|nr:[protein-PII] uridylyltransferase [Alphaproteobacteria bacterium]